MFMLDLFVTAHNGKQPRRPSTGEQVKQSVMHSYHRTLLSNKNEQIINIILKCMNQQGIILSKKDNPKGYILYD